MEPAGTAAAGASSPSTSDMIGYVDILDEQVKEMLLLASEKKSGKFNN